MKPDKYDKELSKAIDEYYYGKKKKQGLSIGEITTLVICTMNIVVVTALLIAIVCKYVF